MKKLSIAPTFLSPENYMIAKLPIAIDNHYVLQPLTRIIRLEADTYCTKIVTTDKTYVIAKNLGHYEKLLPEHSFLRVHNKHIVNLNFIHIINCKGHWCVELVDKTVLQVSDKKQQLLLQKLGIKNEPLAAKAQP
ncbi:MAG: LytTR family DNA-binding domain-containing protein [Bacteroidota bacterium]